jgi:hypothetical protein
MHKQTVALIALFAGWILTALALSAAATTVDDSSAHAAHSTTAAIQAAARPEAAALAAMLEGCPAWHCVFKTGSGGVGRRLYAVFRIGPAGEICFCFFSMQLAGQCRGPSARPVNDADPNSNDVQDKYQ